MLCCTPLPTNRLDTTHHDELEGGHCDKVSSSVLFAIQSG